MNEKDLNYERSWRALRQHLVLWLDDLQVSLSLLTRISWPWKTNLRTNPFKQRGESLNQFHSDIDDHGDSEDIREPLSPDSEEHFQETSSGRAVRAFPLVGIIVGLIAGIAFAISSGLGLPFLVSALIAIAVTAVLTGALHEDGLADTADGFGGGRSKADKLRLMKDSRIGAYGVLTLLLVIAAKVAAIADLESAGKTICAPIASSAVSRAAMPALMCWLPSSRSDGLSATFGKPEKRYVTTGFIIAGMVAIILLGWTGIVAIIAAGTATFVIASLSKRQIGGQTGDVLGATQQVSELFFLLALAAVR